MKKRPIITLALLLTSLCPLLLHAQTDYRSIMDHIRDNHPEIVAARKAFEAERIGLRTGLNPADPTVEMEYGLSKNSPVDLKIVQDFDFPTVYHHQNQIAKLGAAKAEMQWYALVREAMTDARQQYVEIVYLNKKIALYREKFQNALRQNEIYTRKLETGDANQLEKNNINAIFLTVRTDLRIAETQLKSALERLQYMNGGQAVAVADTIYPDFMYFGSAAEVRFVNDALENDYRLRMTALDTMMAERDVKLNRALWLPGLQVGYKASITGSKVDNILVAGIRIPLWNNRNRLKYAKLQRSAVSYQRSSIENSVRTELQTLYNDYRVYTDELSDYQEFIENTSSVRLLNKALDAGEISLTEYLLEIGTWYGTLESALEIEKLQMETRVEMSKYFEF